MAAFFKLTGAQLSQLGACDHFKRLFKTRFGDCLEIQSSCDLAPIALKYHDFDWAWLANAILDKEFIRVFVRESVIINDQYKQTRETLLNKLTFSESPIWNDYMTKLRVIETDHPQAIKPNMETYEDIRTDALDLFHAAIRDPLTIYKTDMKPHYDEYYLGMKSAKIRYQRKMAILFVEQLEHMLLPQ